MRPEVMLARLSLPILIGLMLTASVGVVDAYFVARLGTDALAAMGFAIPTLMFSMGVAVAVGTGIRTATARAIGSGATSAVQSLGTHGITLSLAVFGVLGALSFALQRTVFAALGARDAVADLTVLYMTPIWFGLVFLGVIYATSATLHGTRDVRTPALLAFCVALVNVALCPALVFGVGSLSPLGMRGAGLATTIAWVVAAGFGVFALSRRGLVSRACLTWSELRVAWRSVLSVAIPNALSNTILPLSSAIQTAIVAWYGLAGVAAWGAGMRLQQLATMGSIAIAGSLNVLVGMHWGAGDEAGVRTMVSAGRRLGLWWGTGIGLVCIIMSRPIADAMSNDSGVADLLAMYLRIVPLSYPLTAMVIAASASFNATQRGWMAAMLAMLNGLGFAVPGAYIGGEWFGLLGVFLAVPAASAATWVASTRWLRQRRMLPPMFDKATSDARASVH